jgi:hypothetical protein
MRNLTPSSHSPIAVYRQVVRAKRAGSRQDRLARRVKTIRAYYQEYEDCKYELESIKVHRYTLQQREDLLHCYTQRTRPLNELLADIRSKLPNIISNKCQYCNIDSPQTFDHYLSKGTFPEYAIHALNLLPCCYACNQIKGEKFLDLSGNRRVVNLYFDRLPRQRYLRVQIDFDISNTPSATYSLARPAGLRHRTFQLIQNHYDALDLLVRYRESSNATFSETINSIRAHGYAVGYIEQFLREEADAMSSEISPNYWKSVLFEAMANDPRFVALCV